MDARLRGHDGKDGHDGNGGGQEKRLADMIAELNTAEKRIFDDGLVLILRELHDRLDVAVATAYGWPGVLAEARGRVLWLRPEYQAPRFATAPDKKLDLVGGELGTAVTPAGPKPAFPTADGGRTFALRGGA